MVQRDPTNGVQEPDDAGPETGHNECAPDDLLDDLGPESGREEIEVVDDGAPLGVPELDNPAGGEL
ncbi:hypothetical protein ACWFMI_23325 [Nocardiopsis terrae]|uniref:hypothetical protein n=1 Tax=Streptomyces sp. NPDC057554 TaxID=3350538 RepID=UPI0036CBC180